MRCFSGKDQIAVSKKMEKMVEGITFANGAEYHFSFNPVYNVVNNNPALIDEIENIAIDCFGEDSIEFMQPIMGGEDFSAYQQKIPGAFIFIGAKNEEKGINYPHHHPKFDIDEKSLKMGLDLFVKYTLAKCGSLIPN